MNLIVQDFGQLLRTCNQCAASKLHATARSVQKKTRQREARRTAGTARAYKLRTAARAASPEDREVLLKFAGEAVAKKKVAATPCDAMSIWNGKHPSCALTRHSVLQQHTNKALSSDAVVLIVVSDSAGQETTLGSGFLISAD